MAVEVLRITVAAWGTVGGSEFHDSEVRSRRPGVS